MLILSLVAGVLFGQKGVDPVVAKFKQEVRAEFERYEKQVPVPKELIGGGKHGTRSKREDRKGHRTRPDAERDEEGTDGAWEAAQFERMFLLDSTGKIPPHGFHLAYAQRQANIAYQALNAPKKPGSNSFTPPWVSLGPTNVGGRSRSLVVMPGGTTLIAGSVSGGIWRSTNSGTTWAPVNDYMANLDIDCIVQDPNSTNHLLAGTGEAFFNGDADSGDGIYQSTDGGQTWAVIPSTENMGNIAKIAFCPTNSNNILAATVYNGIWQSKDGGSTWTNVYNAQGAMDVKFSPWDSTRAVADVLDYTSTWTHQAFYSSDGGTTWTACAGIPVFDDFNARMSFGFSQSRSNYVYCVSGNNGGQVWTSTDDGATFTAVSGTGLFPQTWYNNFVLVDPTNSAYSYMPNGPLKSTNNGANYAAIASGYIETSDPHPDVHLGLMDPGFNGTTDTTAYFTTDGGLFKTLDIYTAAPGSGWTSLNNGYVTTQYYSAEGDKSGIYFGGLQDNGSLLLNQGSTVANGFVFGGDGGFVNIDHTNPNNLYGEYVDAQVFASHDGGQSANYIDGGISDADSNANFISPIMLDPNDPNTLLVGASSLWATTNASDASDNPTWTAIRSPGSNLISAIAIAVGNSNDIWVGQNDGGISNTANGTATTPTWNNSFVNAGNGNVTRSVQCITIDPNNNNRVFVSFGGLQSNPLYETTDGGTTWTSASGTGATALPAAPVRYLSIHPDDPSWLFAGTAVGLFQSMDGGATWYGSNDGPANVDVWDTRFIPGTSTILLGTHGRGLWTQNEVAIKSISLLQNSVSAGTPVSGTVTLYGQGDGNTLNVGLSSDNTSVATVSPTVSVGNGISSVGFSVATLSVASSTTVTITASLGVSSQSTTLQVTPAIPLAGIAVAPSTVAGGANTEGTVSLGGAAGSSGETVSIQSNSSTVSVPAMVTVPSSSSQYSFLIKTSPVSSNTAVTITATLGSTSDTATLNLDAATVASISASPNSVVGGTNAEVTVHLTSVAGSAGDVVTLQSTNAAAITPASVTVPSGSSSTSFVLKTKGVSVSTPVTLTATFNSVSQTALLTITPAAVSTVTFTPTSVVGGATATGRVTLSGGAGPSGDVVSLSSGSSAAIVPASVTVPSGLTSATFAVTTKGVNSSTSANITASFAGSTQSASVEITPATLSAFSVSPATVIGGANSEATVHLAGLAGSSGDQVTLSSSNPAALVPASITVPSGSNSYSFLLKTKPVSANTTVTLSATLGSTTQRGTLTVDAVTLSAITVNPGAVVAGANAVGKVTLTGLAGTSGDVVTLQSSNAAATVGASVTVPSGSTAASFAVKTTGVGSSTTVTLTAFFNSLTQSTTLTVNPASLEDLVISPTSVVGGTNAEATLQLNGASGGAVVRIQSSSSLIPVPDLVTIPAGASSYSFLLKTKAVATATAVTITATLGAKTATATITLTP